MFKFKSDDNQLFILNELFKIQYDKQERHGRKVEYIGIRTRFSRAFIFWWSKVDNTRFYANFVSDSWCCYNFETGELMPGTSSMLNHYLSTNVTNDDFVSLVEQSERII